MESNDTKKPDNHSGELPLANVYTIAFAFFAYLYLVYTSVAHVVTFVQSGAFNLVALQFDTAILLGQYAWEVWLAIGMQRCVLQYGAKTWTPGAIMEHHLSTVVAGTVGLIYRFLSRDINVYALFGPVFVSLMLTNANELLMVISALGGEHVILHYVYHFEDPYPVNTTRACIAPVLIANLSLWEINLIYSILQNWWRGTSTVMLMFLPFILGAVLYHAHLLRGYLYKFRRFCCGANGSLSTDSKKHT